MAAFFCGHPTSKKRSTALVNFFNRLFRVSMLQSVPDTVC